ncbi:ABC transporter-like protein [Anopheles sinensis]|uniref:ABC transporter-like protein n=1 Tax=Anopheles sinensis TaxID=74873 RepID=A0A084WFN5_ANOSI|nr:ABC transporter-like protein [Anopheles sinensis]
MVEKRHFPTDRVRRGRRKSRFVSCVEVKNFLNPGQEDRKEGRCRSERAERQTSRFHPSLPLRPNRTGGKTLDLLGRVGGEKEEEEGRAGKDERRARRRPVAKRM